MSERDISRRMEAIRAGQRREAEAAQRKVDEARAREQEKLERVREIRRLAPRFVVWAARNKVPTSLTKFYKEGRKGRLKEIHRSGLWNLASSDYKVPSEADGVRFGTRTARHAVDKKGRIYQEGDGDGKTPLTDDELRESPLKPEDIYQRVAELCVEHGLEAPDL